VAGTLKADEWRTLGTIYLPIALISLWGTDEPSLNSVEQRVLRHTMFLVSAVLLAMKHIVTQEHMDAYRQNMVEYIKGIVDLYPGVKLRTNHHVAMHIYDFLELFGPVKSWWCFPFEHLIGFIQNLTHNHIVGVCLSFSSLPSFFAY